MIRPHTLLHSYMKRQIDGGELHRLVSKRRKLPQAAVDVWKFNRIRQKDGFLLDPLVHGKLPYSLIPLVMVLSLLKQCQLKFALPFRDVRYPTSNLRENLPPCD